MKQFAAIGCLILGATSPGPAAVLLLYLLLFGRRGGISDTHALWILLAAWLVSLFGWQVGGSVLYMLFVIVQALWD